MSLSSIRPWHWRAASGASARSLRPLLQADDASALITLARGLRLASPPRPVARQTVGEAMSAWKGRGLDYADSRVYQPGDDLRDLHWRLLARTGRPYVKVHHEEQATALHLLLDLRPGMAFGTRGRTKAEQAARMTLLAASSAVLAAQGASGPLHLSLWRDAVQGLDLGRGMRAVQRLAQRLQTEAVAPIGSIGAAPSAAGGLTAWARGLLPRLPEGARLILASDGAGWESPECDAALWALSSRAEVLLLEVRDPVEDALPPQAARDEVNFVDLAQGQTGRLSGAAARAQFAEAAARQHAARLARWRARGLRCIAAGVAQSDRTVLQRLQGLLA